MKILTIQSQKVFIDTDILFRYFAINNEKFQKFLSEGTTGKIDLDNAIKIFQSIEENNQHLCVSEITILELICTLKRLNNPKIQDIINSIYQIAEILPIENFELKFAWFLGSRYNLHTGDAFHAAFCIFNKIPICYICDQSFSLTHFWKFNLIIICWEIRW